MRHAALAAATRQELAAAVGDFAASLAPLQASAVIMSTRRRTCLPISSRRWRPCRRKPSPIGGCRSSSPGKPRCLRCFTAEPLRDLERSVGVHCHLEPLTADEVIGYVVHRLAAVGTNARVEFDDSAFAALHAATRGRAAAGESGLRCRADQRARGVRQRDRRAVDCRWRRGTWSSCPCDPTRGVSRAWPPWPSHSSR